MRTKHSFKNVYINIVSQMVITILGFISRKVFLDNLGASYLGINGLLSNVLSALILVEGGIGISIVYNLYKPLAEHNHEKVIALVQLYKKAYGVLAIITLFISIGLFPLLKHLMRDSGNIPFLLIIYSIFVGKNITSYLNAHKWSLINADQRGYILSKYNLFFQILTLFLRIVIILTTQNYVFYLAIELFTYIIQNIANGRVVNKRYPYIKTKRKYELDLKTKENIIKNVKAMFLHNIGGYLVYSTDNVLISSLVSITIVGLYSNYTMITQQLEVLVSPFLDGIGASVGNLIATENKEKHFAIFKISFLINFWIYSLSIVFLYNLLNPFITWWLGNKYLLGNLVCLFIFVNFYLNGMSKAVLTFKNKAGLFAQDKYASLVQGAINLIASILLARIYGLAGIFMGTSISIVLTIFFTQPFITYRHVFNKPVRNYFIRYFLYVCLTIFTCSLTILVINFFNINNSFLGLIERGIISIILPNTLYVFIFCKTQEYKYLYNLISGGLSGFRLKLLSSHKVKMKMTK